MFQFPPCPPTGLCVQPVVTEYCSAGFPHSGTSGSTFDDNSPKLIAAIRALHRLLAPRHPPHALSSLIHVRRQHLIIETYLSRTDKSCAQHVASYFYSAQLLRCYRCSLPTGRLTLAQRSPIEEPRLEPLVAAPKSPWLHPPGAQSQPCYPCQRHKTAWLNARQSIYLS